MDLSAAINTAQTAALAEIKKYDAPNPIQFEIANTQGQRLAELLKVDKHVVMLGTTLMDFKIGQAISENRLKDHIKISKDAAVDLLRPFNLPSKITDKVINCILGHHKTHPWAFPEAEVCANADCYRFLTPRGLISFLIQIGKREMSVDESIKYARSKIGEKWGILSLDICKKELGSNYKFLNQLLNS